MNKKIDAQQLKLFSVLFGNLHLWLSTEACRFNFVDKGRTVADFSNTEVETVNKESDRIQLITLTSTPCILWYMDRREGGGVNYHDFFNNNRGDVATC